MQTQAETKSLQEHFDYVVSNLLRQGVRSYDEQLGECVYRGPGGAKCAAGWLIPDDKYNPRFERKSIWGVIDICSDALPAELRKGKGFDLVGELQRVHDRTEPSEWASQFGLLARHFDLSDAVCKEAA